MGDVENNILRLHQMNQNLRDGIWASLNFNLIHTLILIILTHWELRTVCLKGVSFITWFLPFFFCFLSNWQDFFNCKWQKPTLLRLRGECGHATKVRSDRKQGWGASEHPPETPYFLSPSLTWWPLWPSNSTARHHNHSLTYSFDNPAPLTQHRAVSRNASSAFSTQNRGWGAVSSSAQAFSCVDGSTCCPDSR